MGMNIQQIGKKFVNFLNKKNVELKENEDGRLESLNSEDNVTDCLREEFKNKVNFLPKTHNRAFGDLDIETDMINPINVKMVDPAKTNTFNGGSAKVFNYVLYGETGNITWPKLATKLKNNRPNKIHSEYFYLVYYKRSNMKPVFISLTDVHEDSIVTNPSNPIQLKKNIEFKKRSDGQKVDFMVELAMDVMRKKATPYLIATGAL